MDKRMNTRRQAQLRLLSELEPRFRLEKWSVVTITVLVSVVFPILEAILLEKIPLEMIPEEQKVVFWLPVGVIGVLHALFAVVLTVRSVVSKPLHSIEALESSIHLDLHKEELSRCRESYRLARQVFDILNVRTCRLRDFSVSTPQDYDWCTEGLEPGLDELMSTLVDNRSWLLGIAGSQWTIEIYLDPGGVYLPEETVDEMGQQYQRIWIKCSEGLVPRLNSRITYKVDEYPVGLACTRKEGFVRTIEEDPHLLPRSRDGQLDTSLVYYGQYAILPFKVACKDDDILGAIFVTAEQDENFSVDILDTLGFYGAVISNFVYGYNACVWGADS